MPNSPGAVSSGSSSSSPRGVQISPADETIVRLASAILAGDLLALGLVFLGVITLPFSWPVVLGGGLILGGVALVTIFWAIKSSNASTSSVDETEGTEKREENSENHIDSIENSKDSDEKFEEIDPKTSDSFATAQKDSQERKAARKNDAISQWEKIKRQIEMSPHNPLPLLQGSRLDVLLEALCKNSNSTVGYIEQSSENGQHNDIENYTWPALQRYLVLGLGIQGFNSRNPFNIVVHWARGGSIESHQTLVVIDNSRPEKPVIYYYDPKGTKPNNCQKDAMALDKTIPDRLEKIKTQFAKKLGRHISFEQFHADRPDQSRFNGTDCVYFCAEAAMHITSGQTSQFSKDPRKIVENVCAQIDQAFPKNLQLDFIHFLTMISSTL